MHQPSRIMCAIDLSGRSESAFNYALALATWRHAPLDLVFAVSNRRPFHWRGRERVEQLAEFRRRVSDAGLDMTLTVQHGKPADVIVQHAASSREPPQVIVLGAPRRRTLDRFRSPSVAPAVAYRLHRPTLVVPGAEHESGSVGVPFRRILCAVDFSPASMSAVEETYRIARQDGGTVRLLHVVDMARPAVPRTALEFSPLDDTEQLKAHAWRQFRRLLPLSRELHGRVHPHVTTGLVMDQIVSNARDIGADLVVLGVQKRGVLGRLFGSTTSRAFSRLSSPVLAVPVPVSALRADANLPAIAA